MALTQRLEFRQSQSLVMTPQLMQAIKLLQLSNLDLSAFVEEELERNPLLERESDGPEAPVTGEPAASSIEASESGFGEGASGDSQDSGADGFFILIHLGGVDQSITGADRVGDALSANIAAKPVGAKAEHRHHHAVVKPYLGYR